MAVVLLLEFGKDISRMNSGRKARPFRLETMPWSLMLLGR